MPDRLGASDLTELPLFPLESVVLFPSVRAPLHVFEPRYRQMTEAALAGERRIGMATVLPEHRAELAGDPPLFEIGCAGFVEAFERLADGRFDLVLLGTQRFRIVRERPAEAGRLYRVAAVEWLAEEPAAAGSEPELRAARERVMSSLRELLVHAGRDPAEISAQRIEGLDVEAFTNTLCQMIALPTEEKQGLLEAAGVRARLDTLDGVLQFHLARARLPGRSEAIH